MRFIPVVIKDESFMNESFKNHLLECRVKKKILIVKDDIKLWRNEEGIVIIGIQKFILNPNSLEL